MSRVIYFLLLWTRTPETFKFSLFNLSLAIFLPKFLTIINNFLGRGRGGGRGRGAPRGGGRPGGLKIDSASSGTGANKKMSFDD